MKCICGVLIVLFNFGLVFSGLSDYFSPLTTFFSSSSTETNSVSLSNDIDHKIPYEISVSDEKFISQAIKLTGVQESELDKCQHAVVLRLQKSCHKLNDEELAKLAVALLNCQSLVEGRRIFPCTDSMSIKECTIDMDADTWNTYHLMSNRARAVCYSVRQIQFRGITEQTVNKLMEASKKQLSMLENLADDQKDLHFIAKDTLSTITKGYDEIVFQQEDIKKAQLFGQLSIENNIKRLAEEKKMITENQERLSLLTQSIHKKLEQAAEEIETQAEKSHSNHKELVDDLVVLQDMAKVIFERIDDSSKALSEQIELTKSQYDLTLRQLSEVNNTVHSLVNLIGTTRAVLEERLNWITTALGGTDLAVERLSAIICHLVFLLFSMISCAFLSARLSTRLFVFTLPLINLALSLSNNEYSQDIITLGCSIFLLVIVQALILFGINLLNKKPSIRSVLWSNDNSLESSKNTFDSDKLQSESNHNLKLNEKQDYTLKSNEKYSYRNKFESSNLYTSIEEEDNFSNPTPPASRNGFYSFARSRSCTPLILNGISKDKCNSKTRMGTPCKLTALPGRDYCHKHQNGDSILGSS